MRMAEQEPSTKDGFIGENRNWAIQSIIALIVVALVLGFFIISLGR